VFGTDIVAVEKAALDLMAQQKCFPWVEHQYGPLNGQHPLEVINGRDPYWLVKAAAEEGLTRVQGVEVTVRLESGKIIAVVQESVPDQTF